MFYLHTFMKLFSSFLYFSFFFFFIVYKLFKHLLLKQFYFALFLRLSKALKFIPIYVNFLLFIKKKIIFNQLVTIVKMLPSNISYLTRYILFDSIFSMTRFILICKKILLSNNNILLFSSYFIKKFETTFDFIIIQPFRSSY